MAGSSASYSITPEWNSSSAKNTAATGVRNSPEKPAATAAISRCRLALAVRSRGVSRPAAAAEICTATPSRPTLPPNRWVTQVAPMASGISRLGTLCRLPATASNTSAMPLPHSPPQRAYTNTSAAPAAGSSSIKSGSCSRTAVTARMPWSNTASSSPASTPSPAASTARPRILRQRRSWTRRRSAIRFPILPHILLPRPAPRRNFAFIIPHPPRRSNAVQSGLCAFCGAASGGNGGPGGKPARRLDLVCAYC